MILTALLLKASASAILGKRVIHYHADRPLNSVYIAGGFNGWNPRATPLTANGRDWSTTITVPVGRYGYKFVLNGSEWILDPANPKREDGGNVDFNSFMTVYPDGYEKPCRRGDRQITANVLLHEQRASYITVDKGQLVLSIRLRPNDVQKVEAVINGKAVPMAAIAQDDLYEIDRCKTKLPAKTFSYGFRLSDGGPWRWFGPEGLSASANGRPFVISTSKIPVVKVPSWPERAVLYEIFPDRFANGKKTNDPLNTKPWGSKPDFSSFLGGDAVGVTQHVDYLSALGINGIYFTPVFQSPANHRYSTQDYHKIDPGIGTEAEFTTMTAALRKAGIRSILDGVFSCTGTDFFAFQDLLKHQAASKYRDWYTVHRYPVKAEGTPTYEAWGNYGGLPLINPKNAEFRNYLLGVAPFWNKRSTLSGWRLDSAERLSPEFCRAFRLREKSADPQGWIVGEIWGDANDWLQGDMFDAVMGYQFRGAVVAFVGKGLIGPSEFMNRLMMTYASYAPPVSRNLMNLLDSHDTPRFLTTCGGNKNLALLGAAIQLTWPGTPCIYYGGELGMEGGADPDNRRGMRWDLATSKNRTLQAYRALVAARRSHPVLQTGEPVQLIADDAKGVFAYARVLGDAKAIVIGNRSKAAQTVRIPTKGQFRDVLTNRVVRSNGDRLTVTVGPESALVLL